MIVIRRARGEHRKEPEDSCPGELSVLYRVSPRQLGEGRKSERREKGMLRNMAKSYKLDIL